MPQFQGILIISIHVPIGIWKPSSETAGFLFFNLNNILTEAVACLYKGKKTVVSTITTESVA